MTNILLFASSGVGLRKVETKLKYYLGEKVSIEDIEDVMCQRSTTIVKIKKKRGGHQGKLDMSTITANLPRKEVIEEWNAACEQATANLETKKIDNPNVKVNILAGHALYYGVTHKEFYSPVSTKEIEANLSIDKTVLLIDDFTDMFHRLTGEHDIFGTRSFKKFYADELSSKEYLDKDIITLQWKKNSVSLLFMWRYAELLIVESIASQLKSSFMLWGVKNRLQSFANWIVNKPEIVLYLSHPIATPRELLSSEPIKVGKLMNEINEIPKVLDDIPIVVPTAIDELRIDKSNKSWTGMMEKRWPLVGREDELIYSLPQGANGSEYSDFIIKDVDDTGKLVNWLDSMREDLFNDIKLQISARDHLLVHYSNGIIFYRPYWNKKSIELSTGVESELSHWRQLSSNKNRALFVHFKEDLEVLVENEIDSIKYGAETVIYDDASKKWGENGNAILKGILKRSSNKKGSSPFIVVPPDQDLENDIRESLHSMLVDAIRTVLVAVLTGKSPPFKRDKEPQYFEIMIVEDFDEFTESKKKVISFLRGASLDIDTMTPLVDSIVKRVWPEISA